MGVKRRGEGRDSDGRVERGATETAAEERAEVVARCVHKSPALRRSGVPRMAAITKQKK